MLVFGLGSSRDRQASGAEHQQGLRKRLAGCNKTIGETGARDGPREQGGF